MEEVIAYVTDLCVALHSNKINVMCVALRLGPRCKGITMKMDHICRGKCDT